MLPVENQWWIDSLGCGRTGFLIWSRTLAAQIRAAYGTMCPPATPIRLTIRRLYGEVLEGDYSYRTDDGRFKRKTPMEPIAKLKAKWYRPNHEGPYIDQTVALQWSAKVGGKIPKGNGSSLMQFHELTTGGPFGVPEPRFKDPKKTPGCTKSVKVNWVKVPKGYVGGEVHFHDPSDEMAQLWNHVRCGPGDDGEPGTNSLHLDGAPCPGDELGIDRLNHPYDINRYEEIGKQKKRFSAGQARLGHQAPSKEETRRA